MCKCVCLLVEPVLRSKDYVRSRIQLGSVVCLDTPVSTSVPELDGIYATGGIPFRGCTFGGVYIPCIYPHARWSYRRRFRSLLLCPLSVERYCFLLFVDSARWFYSNAGPHIYRNLPKPGILQSELIIKIIKNNGFLWRNVDGGSSLRMKSVIRVTD